MPAGATGYRSQNWLFPYLDQAGGVIAVFPQGSQSDNADPEYHNWGPGHNWETALAVELPRIVDSRYRTLARRAGRAIIGISAGGYGAAVIGIHHPGVYSVIESWSGYFYPTSPDGTARLDLGSKSANAWASIPDLVPRLKQQFKRWPTYFAFYVGAQDPTFVSNNIQLDRSLQAATVPHRFALYQGDHSTTLWQRHAQAWLTSALAHLASAARQ